MTAIVKGRFCVDCKKELRPIEGEVWSQKLGEWRCPAHAWNDLRWPGIDGREGQMLRAAADLLTAYDAGWVQADQALVEALRQGLARYPPPASVFEQEQHVNRRRFYNYEDPNRGWR